MGNFDFSYLVTTILIWGTVLVVIFLILREVICWYWKINKTVALLSEIRDLLAAKEISGTPPISGAPPISGTPGPTGPAGVESTGKVEASVIDEKRYSRESINAAKQMAASGYSIEEISKHLHEGWSLNQADATDLAYIVKGEPSPVDQRAR